MALFFIMVTGINIHLILYGFTPKPTYFLASIRKSMFFFMVFTSMMSLVDLHQDRPKPDCPIQFHIILVFMDLLMTHSKSKMNIGIDNISPFFRPYLTDQTIF
jgi:hypothetical protein